jgi:hypothetical protein
MQGRLSGWFYLNKHPEGTVPGKVVTGTLLLYIALLLQMVSNWFDGINLAAFVFLFGFLFYFIFMTGEGRKWARIVLLILTLFNCYALVISIIHPALPDAKHAETARTYLSDAVIKTPLLLTVLFVTEIVLELVAMLLLFSNEAKGWFNRERVKPTLR